MEEALSTIQRAQKARLHSQEVWDMEKQTIQSGWGLEGMKGISEAPVVHSTNRSTASNNQEEQTLHFVKLKGSLLLKLALLKGGLKGTPRKFSSFRLHSRRSISLCSFSPRNERN